MKRRLFWLVGIPAAAQIKLDESACFTLRGRCKPANNQCPMCGTMASPFILPPPEKCVTYVSNMPIANGQPFFTEPACPPETKLLFAPYRQNLTRCHHCNNAFWQDAEAAK